MERGWQAITPVDGVEKYARIQRHAAGQQERGGGQKGSRKRQSEDGTENRSADGAEAADFHSCLIRQFLLKARTDNQKMKESIESMGVDKQTGGGSKSFAEILAIRMAAR